MQVMSEQTGGQQNELQKIQGMSCGSAGSRADLRALLYMKYGREGEKPVDGVLVDAEFSWEAGTAA